MAQARKSKTVRVAAAQFAVGVDVEANLAACLHWLREAGKCKPDLVVLPEFANHASWYDDGEHCYRVSVDLDGAFIKAISEVAAEISAYVVVNCTVRRESQTCTGTSVLISPEGEVLADNDKQVLIGHENNFLQRARQPGPIVDTPIGRLGLYSCMDGVVAETPRCLALRGAQILCNSLNSFATDEGSLHIPVRAAENRVFVVAANKVGALIPEALLEPVSQQTGIPVRFLSGAGDSQIVAPDGTVLALASADQPEVIWADIDPLEVGRTRPDLTNMTVVRRPDLYRAIAEDPETQTEAENLGAERVEVAALQLPGVGVGALPAALDLIHQAAASGARYVVLPELFYVADLEEDQLDQIVQQSEQVLAAIAAQCGELRVATNRVVRTATGHRLEAVLVDASGVIHAQAMVHRCMRHGWSDLGDEISSIVLDDAHVAVLTSDDALFPELGRLLAMRGVNLLLVPAAPLEAWELRTGLVERAAENRINLVAATQPGVNGSSLIASLQKDFTVMTPWEERPFDGLLSQPVLTRAPMHPGVTCASVFPANAANKVVSLGTDLLRGRAWWLSNAITAAPIDETA